MQVWGRAGVPPHFSVTSPGPGATGLGKSTVVDLSLRGKSRGIAHYSFLVASAQFVVSQDMDLSS